MKYDDIIIGMFCRYKAHTKVEVMDKDYRGTRANVYVREINSGFTYRVSPRDLQELVSRKEMKEG